MTTITVFIEPKHELRVVAFDYRAEGTSSAYGVDITVGGVRTQIFQLSAEQAESLSVQLHTAAITLGLVVSDPEPDTGADDSGIDLDRAAAASGF